MIVVVDKIILFGTVFVRRILSSTGIIFIPLPPPMLLFLSLLYLCSTIDLRSAFHMALFALFPIPSFISSSPHPTPHLP